jgi:hypothetical protein
MSSKGMNSGPLEKWYIRDIKSSKVCCLFTRGNGPFSAQVDRKAAEEGEARPPPGAGAVRRVTRMQAERMRRKLLAALQRGEPCRLRLTVRRLLRWPSCLASSNASVLDLVEASACTLYDAKTVCTCAGCGGPCIFTC